MVYFLNPHFNFQHVVHAYEIDADATTYQFTGSAGVQIRHGYLLAESATYAFTGTDATVHKQQIPFTMDPGIYAFQGSTALPRYGFRATAGQGTYTFVGAPQTLRGARVVTAAAGSYTFAGTDVTLKNTRRLAAGLASYALTGTDAALRHGEGLAAGGGTYALTGTDGSLKHGWKLALAGGSYAITGASVTLTIASTAWTPASLGAVLLGWFKGDTLTGSDADPISTWPDASGLSKDMTQSGGNRPLLEAAYLNSKNVVQFIGANQLFFNATANMFSGATAGSAYLVIKITTDPPVISGRAGLWRFGSEVGAGAATNFPFTDGVVYDGFGSTARKTTGDPTPALTSWRIVGWHSVGSDWGMLIDGTSHYSTVTNTVGFDTTTPGLGRSDSGVGTFAYLDGWIAEAVFTNAKQSSTDREKMEGYLAHKWGIAANLDSGHPYKAAPP